MTDQSFKISAERQKDNLFITLQGDVTINELNALKDQLLRKTEDAETIQIVLKQPGEIRFTLLQLLLALRNTKGQQVDISVVTSEEQRELMNRAGLSSLFNIKKE